MKDRRCPWLAQALCAGLLWCAPPLEAAALYTEGHGDLGIDFNAESLSFAPRWGLSPDAVVDGVVLTYPPDRYDYAPDALTAQTTATVTLSTQQAAWLDAESGSTAYRLGNDYYEPNLGFSTEGIGTDWAPLSGDGDGEIRITLTSWSGPGNAAIFYSASPVTLFYSTNNPSATVANNSWDLEVGGHTHLSWLLTTPGYYEFTFTWMGMYLGTEGSDPVEVSGQGTFGFQVGAVPEPGTWGLLATALLGLALGKSCSRFFTRQSGLSK